MHHHLTYLPCPASDYLTLSELAVWLGLDRKTVRKHIQAGNIPQGKVRAGGTRLYWGQVEAAIAKWNMDNLDRYETPG